MDTERWLRAKEILGALDELAPDQRAARIAEACGDDADLKAEVERLVALDAEADSYFGELRDALGQGQASQPEQIGVYRIIREIGRGGMGTVFLGERCDGQFEQQVAIKVVRERIGSRLIARFRDERRILAQLEHPGIAYLLDGGSLPDGRPYFIMEHVEGESITSYCDRKRLDLPARLGLFRSICAAVAYAHRNLVVHRDLKPGNVMVEEDDLGQPSIKLLDFGIARIIEAGIDDEDAPADHPRTHGVGVQAPNATHGLVEGGLTQHDERLLTPRYAAPEQIRGEHASTAADIYALGVLLYQLLTGSLPFAGAATHEQLERAILEDDPAPPSEVAREIDGDVAALRGTTPTQLARRLQGDLDSIVQKALQKQPEHRYASAGKLSDDIKRHLGGKAIAARPATWTYRTGLFVRRHRWGVAAATIALLASLSLSVLHVSRIAHERDLANAAAAKAEAEAAKAEEVAGLLIEMFESADPSQARGEDVTVREVLDRAAAKLDDGLASQPAVQAQMKHIMGGIYVRLGEYDTAADLLQQSLEMRRELYGPRHRDVAQSLQSLAVLAWARGHYQQAEDLLRDALAQCLELFGPDHLEVARIRNDLAAVLRREGKLDETELLYQQALATRRAQLGEQHPDVVSSLNNLATLMSDQGRTDAAESLYREVLAMRRKNLGPIHPRIANSIENLAVLLREQRRFAEAETLAREALAMHLALYDEDHSRVADTMNTLAGALRGQGRYDEAEVAYRKALVIRRKVFGEDNLLVADSLNNLANLYRDRDRPADAEPLYRQAIGIYREGVGAEHAWTATSIKNLGELFLEMDNAAAAEVQFREALRIRELTRSADHSPIAEARSLLGASLARQGQWDIAEPLLLQAHTALEQSRGAQDPKTQDAYARLLTARQYHSTGP
ncbi:tetratricopeptide repeat protein [Lysobacter sp. A289]